MSFMKRSLRKLVESLDLGTDKVKVVTLKIYPIVPDHYFVTLPRTTLGKQLHEWVV